MLCDKCPSRLNVSERCLPWPRPMAEPFKAQVLNQAASEAPRHLYLDEVLQSVTTELPASLKSNVFFVRR